ncbi:MAG: hypothetical protein WC548_04720 [Candidatus Pacearchaeota archaeon]
METLQQITEMQNQGFSDEEIYNRLRNMGISPKEIQDSLNQAKIKKAIYEQDAPQNTEIVQPQYSQIRSSPLPQFNQPNNYPQPSEIMQYQTPEASPYQQYPENDQYENQTGNEYPQEEQGYAENQYAQSPSSYQDQNYYAPVGTNSETISEIAEQIVSEKISEFKKETEELISFKTRIQDKVSDIDDRLKRIEHSIDKLQQSIIGKMGEFGDNASLIHRDLDNLHGTMSKLVNPLMDNYKELEKIKKK